MNIWIVDHYSVPPQYYPLARQTVFAKELMKRGHKVTIFCASTVHNSDINLINDKCLYRGEIVDDVQYVYINCKGYSGNGVKRILNMIEFARKLPGVCKNFEKPDSVLACSMTLQACKEAIILAKKSGAKAVAQITDLWPETLIAYGKCGKSNPAVWYLRRTEKWIYKKCDHLIFSMEGAYDYIKEQCWQKDVPLSKVSSINNCVDLPSFDSNVQKYITEDDDLDNTSITKVIYTGSVRAVNNLGILLDVAKNVQNPHIKFLIYGDGDERAALEKRVTDEIIGNVVFKGRVDKKYIPYIVSKADVNIVHNFSSPIFRFGISMNKIFDYFAAGKPIFCDFRCEYNPVIMSEAGKDTGNIDPVEIAKDLEKMLNLDTLEFSRNARKAAEEKYNYDVMVEKLTKVLC